MAELLDRINRVVCRRLRTKRQSITSFTEQRGQRRRAADFQIQTKRESAVRWTDSLGLMELETINKLYLELSQVATAKTKRELDLEELLRSAHCIAERKGEGTAWWRFEDSIKKAGIGSVTARTYRVLPSDEES